MRETNSKVPLFLIEIIVSILFLSLSLAYCLKMFALSRTLADTSKYKSCALEYCQSAVETFKANKGECNKTLEALGDKNLDGNIYLSENMNVTSKEDAFYTAKFTYEEGTLCCIEVTFYRGEREIYALSGSYYKGENK